MAPDTHLQVVSNDGREQEVQQHVQSFAVFRRMITFAALHIALTLVCVALAFIGDVKLIAFLLWSGGTLAMIGVLAVHSTNANPLVSSSRDYKQGD
jgi:hypothetical protein